MAERIAVISCVRNEADFLPTWLEQVQRLADIIIVCDHLSTDNTPSILQRARGVHFWHNSDPAYNQENLLGLMAVEAFSLGADWVIPLDADEVIALPPDQLRARLAANPRVLRGLYWLPVIPGSRGGWWVAPNVTSEKKTAVPKALWPGVWNLGSHDFAPQSGPAPLLYLADLWHFPLRSVAQARRKMQNGARALDLREDRGGPYNHWRVAAQALQVQPLTEAGLRLWAMQYPGPPPPEGTRVPSTYQLRSWGWTHIKEIP